MREDSDLAILREMANLAREYFDERNRPAVSWDGMPSVQDQKHRRERIVAIIDRLSSPPSRGSDSELIDWLESEHVRVDPVARLVVKQRHDRNSGEWADVSHDVRGTLQSLAGDTGKPEPRRLRQVRPHTPGPGYICGLCNASHVLGCRDGRIDNARCPSAPLVTESAGGQKP